MPDGCRGVVKRLLNVPSRTTPPLWPAKLCVVLHGSYRIASVLYPSERDASVRLLFLVTPSMSCAIDR